MAHAHGLEVLEILQWSLSVTAQRAHDVAAMPAMVTTECKREQSLARSALIDRPVVNPQRAQGASDAVARVTARDRIRPWSGDGVAHRSLIAHYVQQSFRLGGWSIRGRVVSISATNRPR
jgi:hypothetical protein